MASKTMEHKDSKQTPYPLDLSLISNACEAGRSPAQSSEGIQKLREALLLGANPNESRRKSRSPLAYACEIGALCAARELLDHGALASPKILTEMTPLVQSCFRGHDQLTLLLLERGADPNEPVGKGSETQSGLTALHAAAAGGWRACAEALLKAGADPLARIGWNGMTPSEAAMHNANYDLADFIDAFILAREERQVLQDTPAANPNLLQIKVRL